MDSSARLLAALLAAAPAMAEAQDAYQSKIAPAHVKMVDAAKSDLKSARVDSAIDTLQNVVAEEPSYFRAHYNLGLAQLTKGDTKAGTAELAEALAIKERENIKDYTIYNSLGWAYLLQRDYPNAEHYLLLAASHEADNGKASNTRIMNNLGILYTQTGRYDEARKYLVKARDQYGSSQATLNLQILENLEKSAKNLKRS